jgi:hypothetical protein
MQPKSSAFTDRRGELFARDLDIGWLTDRAQRPGLTVIFAPARMGKTWTIQEVARRLSLPPHGFMVGYHEAMGGSSHLLRTVSDLYTRWLPNSSYLDQAKTLWELHKDELVAKLGQGAGALFDSLKSLVVPSGIGGAIDASKIFGGLAQAQSSLQTAGLQLPPLDYDQALAVTSLVARLSDAKVTLILDAFDMSETIARDASVLEGFLNTSITGRTHTSS